MTRSDWATACDTRLQEAGFKNFSALEISDVGRKCGDAVLVAPPLDLLNNATRLMMLLEWVRRTDGEAPVLVNSWYRDPAYNAAVGGVSHSMHLTLGAADIVKVGWSPADVADLLGHAPHKHMLGIGRYKSFTHIDIRGMIGRPAPARWGSNE